MNYYLITKEIADIFSIYGVPTYTKTQGGITEYYVQDWPSAVITVYDSIEADDIIDANETRIEELLAEFDVHQIYRSTESLSPYAPY